MNTTQYLRQLDQYIAEYRDENLRVAEFRVAQRVRLRENVGGYRKGALGVITDLLEPGHTMTVLVDGAEKELSFYRGWWEGVPN